MKTLVLLSGGLDSTVALHWSLREHAETRSLAIDYGQRHMIELNIAGRIARAAGRWRHPAHRHLAPPTP